MAEKDFQAELCRGLSEQGFAYKIEDIPVSQFGRATSKKPFDVVWWGKGFVAALELKQVAWKLDITCEDNGHSRRDGLQPHQEQALFQVLSLGHPAFVVVHFHGDLPKTAQKLYPVPTLDRAVAVRIGDLINYRQSTGKTKVDFPWCLENGQELTLYRTNGKRAWRWT